MTEERIKPLDSFRDVFNILRITGLFMWKEPKNRIIYISYQLYRIFVLFAIIGYNLIHIIFIAQNLRDVNLIFDTLMVELPQLNLLIKFIMIYLQSPRIHKLNELLNDPIFAPNSNKDEELLLESKKLTDRLWKYLRMDVIFTWPVWLLTLFFKRYLDPTAIVHIYAPFEVNSWGRYTVTVIMEMCCIFWTGYGHLAMDCAVAMFYAQSVAQLKIVKYNLEHLFDGNTATNELVEGRHRYSDEIDEDIEKRFVYYVKRYEKLAWFTREIMSIFNVSTSIQLLTAIAAACAATYALSLTYILSLQFLFFFVFLAIILVEIFIYCYFGNLVQFESQSVATALYLSDWQSASPRFRRTLLIAMLCWSRPLTPSVSGIIPLSLDTFVTFLKSAYTLYTVNSSVVGSKQQ